MQIGTLFIYKAYQSYTWWSTFVIDSVLHPSAKVGGCFSRPITRLAWWKEAIVSPPFLPLLPASRRGHDAGYSPFPGKAPGTSPREPACWHLGACKTGQLPKGTWRLREKGKRGWQVSLPPSQWLQFGSGQPLQCQLLALRQREGFDAVRHGPQGRESTASDSEQILFVIFGTINSF